MIRVSSFDIFDTCLTRTFAYPMDLFREVGEIAIQNGWIHLEAKEFMTRRRVAEREARKLVPFREVSLEQIYQQLGRDLGLSPEVTLRLQETELLLEGQSLQPIGETRQRIREARLEGRQILFLSDMYLSTSFLEELLKRHGFHEDGDLVYISGEVGRHKSDGGLFQHAREHLKKEITEWTHWGDNPRADVEAPRRLGLHAEHFRSGLLNRYELRICPTIRTRHELKARLMGATQTLYRERWQSRFVAAMRLARLAKPRDLSPREQTIWDTGANVAGPLFYGYVKWVLEEANRNGVPRLYFVARDGQILHKIAGILQSCRKSPVDCRYLFGSRHAWLPASLREVDETQLRWMLAPTPGLTVREVFRRIDVAPEKYKALLEASVFPEAAWNEPLDPAKVKQLAQVLQGPGLSAEIKALATAKRENLLSYFRREGFFEQEKIGIADLGWRGSLKQALVQVCEQATEKVQPQVIGFYLALVGADREKDDGFLGYVNSLRPDALGGFLFFMQLLEAFAAADHGQVRGYRQGQPVLSAPDNVAVSEWGLHALQGGILAFCQAFGALDEFAYPPEDYLDATLSVLKLFYEDPTHEEVEAWGPFPFSDEQCETDLRTLLPSWNRGQAIAALLTKDGRKRLWWAPALARREKMPSLRLYYRLQKLWRTQLKPGTT